MRVRGEGQSVGKEGMGWDGMGEVRRARREECGEACEPRRSQDGVICAVENHTEEADPASLLFLPPSQENVALLKCIVSNVRQSS